MKPLRRRIHIFQSVLTAGVALAILAAPGPATSQGRYGDRAGYRDRRDHYRPFGGYERGASVDLFLSPYRFYLGIHSPAVGRGRVFIAPPVHVFVDLPIILGGRRNDPYSSGRPVDNEWKGDDALSRAVYDLEDAFRKSDIELLSTLTDPNVKIAIFATEKYEYSMAPKDYLDVTREFMRSAHTTDFSVYRVHRKAAGAFQVFARHTYSNEEGEPRMAYLCAVLERTGSRWVLTQIDSAPQPIRL